MLAPYKGRVYDPCGGSGGVFVQKETFVEVDVQYVKLCEQATMSKPDNSNQFLLYTAPDGAVKVEVFYKDETVWLTQKALAELFGVQVPGINTHLKNIFESGELVEAEVISILETTTPHGAIKGKTQTQKTQFYNLDAIIAVGYRVNSFQATQFRIWATKTLREFLIKGFVLDDERLKQGKRVFGKDYFDELLERIREIRASERRFYQKLTDIYALSLPYDIIEGDLGPVYAANCEAANKTIWKGLGDGS